MPQENSDTSNWLTHQWVVAGIVSSAARFIPVPFVDDIVRELPETLALFAEFDRRFDEAMKTPPS